MKTSTADLTNAYIKEHADIRSCLKKGLINYSSLARLIAKELKVEKKTSQEAILVAARRFREQLKSEINNEKKIQSLLSESEIEIKNKICVFILERSINMDYIDEVQKTIRNVAGIFYLIECSQSYTIITQEKYINNIEKKFKFKVIEKNQGLALINFISSKDIEQTIGVVSYLTTLFAEHGINIIEFISSWTDTLFIIDSKHVNKAMNFLKF